MSQMKYDKLVSFFVDKSAAIPAIVKELFSNCSKTRVQN